MSNVTFKTSFAVALVHYPILNRKGERSTTAVTSIDIHDFVRTCAMYDVGPVYMVHPAEGMHALIKDVAGYWLEGAGEARNPGRTESIKSLKLAKSIEEVLEGENYRLWYTSASPPSEAIADIDNLSEIKGKHLIVFGTGSGLDYEAMPKPNGWLSPIEGIGMVRHLSVRAALAIYLDRLCRKRY
ncbi:MAG: RNA methyltransferase [Mariprofundaceae bacterium]